MSTKNHWETVYKGKPDNEVSWYQSKPELSLKLIRHSGVSDSASIIDVGGGSSLFVDFLGHDGFKNITVLDISGAALRVAQNRLGEGANLIGWIEADITQYQCAKTFDLWHDRAVFHFLTKASDRKKYVDLLHQAIRLGGHVIIAAFAIGGPKKCSGLDIVQYDAEKLSQELGEAFILVEQEDESHTTPGGKVQAFGYYRFKKQ